MIRALIALALAVAAAGCERILGLGEPTLAADAAPGAPDAPDAPAPDCHDFAPTTTRQFVIAAFDAPATSNEAQSAGFDVDGDSRADNAMFNVLAALVTFEPQLALQPTIDASLAQGALLQLVQAELGDRCAMTKLYEGADRDVPANPADNFSGQESFRVVGIARGRMIGGRAGDAVIVGPGGTAELRLPLFRGAAPIELPLVEARVRYTVTADGAIDGAIGGAIRSDVVDGLVIPSFAASLQDVVARDCTGSAPDCCPPDSLGRSAASIFDKNHDCAIEVDEVRDNSLVMSLFAPDLDLYNGGTLEPNVDGINDAVSIGIPFAAVNAFFLPPP